MPNAAKTTKPTLRTRRGTRASAQPGLVMPRDFTPKDISVARDVPGGARAVVKLFGDPAAEAKKMFARIGDLSGVKLFGNRILVAKYERTTVGTSGMLLAAAKTQIEDKFQGKVGLVIKIGTVAFADDKAQGIDWHGDSVKLGDWVFYAYGDGTDLDMVPAGTSEHVACKILREGEIHGIVPRPDFMY